MTQQLADSLKKLPTASEAVDLTETMAALQQAVAQRQIAIDTVRRKTAPGPNPPESPNAPAK